jgi:hypothetical protein
MYQALLEECIPSIRNNIWCYPTSRVLSTYLVLSILVNDFVYSYEVEDLSSKFYIQM